MTGCAEWNDALMDCALGGPPGPELEEHLASCPGCSAVLGEWRRKATEMDATLHNLMVAEPGPDGPARVLARLESESRKPVHWQLALAAGVIVGVLAVAIHWPAAPVVPSGAAALSAWRSPTESLLRSPADPLLKGVPRLGESFFEMNPTGVKDAQ